jgi:hypothetical protein
LGHDFPGQNDVAEVSDSVSANDVACNTTITMHWVRDYHDPMRGEHQALPDTLTDATCQYSVVQRMGTTSERLFGQLWVGPRDLRNTMMEKGTQQRYFEEPAAILECNSGVKKLLRVVCV